jgi:hypothetical protein
MTTTPFDAAFQSRSDLRAYGSNALLLFALQLHHRIQDIHTVAADALTDGRDDKKCDLVYIDQDNGIAVVAQGYMAENSSKPEAPANKASDLNAAATWLLTQPLDDLPSRLKSAATELRDAIEENGLRSIEFWYVHNLPGSENVKNELRAVESSVRAALNTSFPQAEVDSVAALEVSREVLSDWYKNLTVPILVSDTVDVTVPGGFSVSKGGWDAFVTAVPADWLHAQYRNHGHNLFSANVRGYLGSRRAEANINNGIKKTARDSPQLFWAFNNGLTAIVNDFRYNEASGLLTILGLSIVNGAQTTGAIGSLDDPPESDALVPARFVKSVDPETVNGIIRFNNSQNRIEAPDFRSNDPIQRRLVSEFMDIPNATYLGGRRGGSEDVIRRPANLIPSDTAAQALAAFHQDPITAYNQKSKIWLSDELYSRYYSEKTTAAHIVFAYSLLRAVERAKRNLKILDASDQLSEAQQRQFNFLRFRGSTFLLTAAVSRCLEQILSKPISNRFRLCFSDNVSPDHAKNNWSPVLDSCMAFAAQLKPAVERGLNNSETVKTSLQIFQDMIQATAAANQNLFGHFAGKVAC